MITDDIPYLAETIIDHDMPTPYENTIRNENIHLVRKAIQSLPEIERDIVKANIYKRMTHLDLSRLYHCNKNTITAICNKPIKIVKQYLDSPTPLRATLFNDRRQEKSHITSEE